MSARRRRALRLALLLIASWPLLQIALAFSFQVNPWKLGAWGMYAAPQLVPQVGIECIAEDSGARFELRTVHPSWQSELDAFVWRRRGLGRLATPERLARALLDAYPQVAGVEITVEQPRLNRRTGMIEADLTTYVRRRNAADNAGPRSGR